MLSSVVRVGGPFPQAIQAVMGAALIADSFEAASRIAPTVQFPVVTPEGDVFRGKYVVTGGVDKFSINTTRGGYGGVAGNVTTADASISAWL